MTLDLRFALDQKKRRPASTCSILRALVVLASLALSPMQAGAWGLSVPGVEVVDTGIEVARGETHFTAIWLDERRVMFSELIDPAAYEKRTANDPREYEQIVIYDVLSKEKKIYAKGGLSCVRNGRIAYWVKQPDTTVTPGYRSVLMTGEMGHEQPTPRSAGRFINSDDCAMQERVPEHKFGRLIRYLKREHGFIDGGNNFGKGEDKYSTPAVLHRPGQPPVTLPFMGAYIGDEIYWSEYWGGYILQYSSGPYVPPRGVTPPPSATRLLKPGEQISVFPHGGMQTKTYPVAFRRINWTVDRVGDSGVYVRNDESKQIRVHAGLILSTSGIDSVSPDGCRVAFGSRQGFLYDIPAYLMILNVCGEKK